MERSSNYKVKRGIRQVLDYWGRSSRNYPGGYCGNFSAGLRKELGHGTPVVLRDKATGVPLHVMLDVGEGRLADIDGLIRKRNLGTKRSRIVRLYQEEKGLSPTGEVSMEEAEWSKIQDLVGNAPYRNYYRLLKEGKD